MKKFLRMLNDFLNVRDYEMRVRDENKRLQSELTYCQDLLLSATVTDPREAYLTSRELQAKTDVYVAYIKTVRQNKARLSDLMGQARKTYPKL